MPHPQEPSTTLPAARQVDDAPQLFVRNEQIAALIHEIEQLHKAMESRAAIEQAKGVLMATMRIGPDAAFAVLVAASQRENRKVREIAERLVASQEAPQ